MNVFLVGQLVHTIGAALLGAMFLYLSRSGGNRALHAAGVAWAFLSLSLASLLVLSGRGLPLENFLFQYWKLFFVVALVTHESARYAGPAWIALGLVIFVGTRLRAKVGVLQGVVKRGFGVVRRARWQLGFAHARIVPPRHGRGV